MEPHREPTPTAKTFPDSLPPGWRALLGRETDAPYFKDLMRFLRDEWKSGKDIFPARENIFRALQELDLPDVRVLIIGQDPYHGAGQAIGRSFAVPNAHFPKPPSLRNILKELATDVGVTPDRAQSDLSGWSAQGVLLLNTVLTVRSGEAFSHRDQGWERFTDRVIAALNERAEPVVFILWGSAAIAKKKELDTSRHIVLESPHPSPLSAHRGFFGSRPFSKVNTALKRLGKAPIDWARVTATP